VKFISSHTRLVFADKSLIKNQRTAQGQLMSAYFVLSTGRCATQWLTELLRQQWPLARVEHEPLHFQYRPDINSATSPLQHNAELLQQHLQQIQQQLDTGRPYIETGFPCWRHLHWFRQQLTGPVKILHLHREPLSTVRSLLKLNAFVPPLFDYIALKNFYLPDASQDQFKMVQALWPTLQPAEKNLCYWLELQAYALQLQQDWPASDWLSLSFSELVSGSGLAKIEQFFAVPTKSTDTVIPAAVDLFGGGWVPAQLEFPQLSQHQKWLQQANALIQQLGYPPLAFAETYADASAITTE
jgi:hypothetical protein